MVGTFCVLLMKALRDESSIVSGCAIGGSWYDSDFKDSGVVIRSSLHTLSADVVEGGMEGSEREDESSSAA
jgi:hypothetical protein